MLSILELELLILAAALHDIGMVYTDEAKAHALTDRQQCDHFILDFYGLNPHEWDERTQQCYLRDRHPFRVHERLNEAA